MTYLLELRELLVCPHSLMGEELIVLSKLLVKYG